MGFIDEKGGRLRVKKWGTAKRVIWRTPPPRFYPSPIPSTARSSDPPKKQIPSS